MLSQFQGNHPLCVQDKKNIPDHLKIKDSRFHNQYFLIEEILVVHLVREPVKYID